jgi:hypothetical protein
MVVVMSSLFFVFLSCKIGNSDEWKLCKVQI